MNLSSSTDPEPKSCRLDGGRQPLFFPTLAFALGILAARFWWHPPVFWLVLLALAGTLSAILLIRRSRLAFASTLSVLLLSGGFVAQFASVPVTSPDVSQYTTGEELRVTGFVVRDGVTRDGSYGGLQQSVDIQVESAQLGHADIPANFVARINVYTRAPKEADSDEREPAASVMPQLVYGQRLQLTAKLRDPKNYGNPGAFDYRLFLAKNGVAVLGSAKFETLQFLPGMAGSRWQTWRSRARHSALAHIRALWPERQAALMSAMLIGDRSGIRRDTSTEFQVSGTYHILVVSGINVGILAFFVFWALRRIQVRDVVATSVTLLLTLGYNFIADTGAPIQRATLMLALYLATRLLYRDHSGLNSVGLSALIILALDPQGLFDPSFQLTFFSVLTIAGIGAPVLERTSELTKQALAHFTSTRYDLSLRPWQAQLRLDVRLITERLNRFIGRWASEKILVYGLRGAVGVFELLVISALMQVALALPMAWYFHRATTVGLAANIIAVPLAGVLMPAAVLAVAASYLSTYAAWPLSLVASWALDGITGTVGVLSSLRVADLRIPVPSVLMCVIAILAFTLALLLAPRRKWIASLGLAVLAVASVLIAVSNPAPEHSGNALEVTAIDVGQGDSIFLVTPEGKSLLVDSGGLLGGSRSEFDIGEDVVSPYLWSRRFNRLDAVAMSHGHADHIGGMCSVIANFRPRELWMAQTASSREVERLLSCARAYNVTVRTWQQNDQFEFGGAHVRVLWPPRDWELKSRIRDDDSLVLHVSYGRTSVLLEGDSEKKAELGIAEQAVGADLLKVGHHGSHTSSLPELLDEIQPTYAVISAGTRNPFGHPQLEVLQRLASKNVRTWRTDTTGAVTFLLDGERVTATPARLQ